MNFGSDNVLSESQNFMNFGLLFVNTTDELGYVFVPTTRVGRLYNDSNCPSPGNDISKATSDILSDTKPQNHYNFKSDFETRSTKG